MKVRVFIEVKSQRWTLWSEDGKTHLGYRDHLLLKDVTFFVDSKKSVKTKITGRRTPHAWAVGSIGKSKSINGEQITYNPFTDKTFKNSSGAVHEVNVAFFRKDLKIFTK